MVYDSSYISNTIRNPFLPYSPCNRRYTLNFRWELTLLVRCGVDVLVVGKMGGLDDDVL